MRRTILLLAGVLLCVVALGSDSPKEYDDKTENVGIEGRWRLTEIIDWNGEKQGIQDMRPFRFENYRIDKNHNPPHLDRSFADFKGRTFRFIYQLDGDTLRIAGNERGNFGRRPEGFNDIGNYVWTYKRVK